MRVFVTGASGFIGTAVVKELIGHGHQVVGLARSPTAGAKLVALGAAVAPGSIEDLDSVRRGVAGANGAIHTAFFHSLGHMRIGTRLRVLLGGAPTQIMQRFVGTAVRVDRAVIATLGEVLGRDRPIVAPFGTLGMTAGEVATEDVAHDASAWGGMRSANENTLEELASRGVRAIAIRLPPIVHGPNDGGFAKLLFGLARKNKQAAYVGLGNNRWPSVHLNDAARLFRLALEKGEAGAKYHGVGEEGIAFKAIAGVLGKQAGVGVVSVPAATSRHFSFLSGIVGVDNPASSELTRKRLGWQPSGIGLLADLDRPEYYG
jgi:nucleoside-diphosphate-sugar epimerase